MKQLLNPLIVVVLLVPFSLLQAQPRILSFAFDENVLPDGWWEISTNPQAKWKVGKISSFDESTSSSLNLHHLKGFGDDLSIVHSESYQLPQTESL